MHTENAIFINAKERKIEVVTIEKLEDAQKLVEGYMTHVGIEDRVGLYVNEEGELKNFAYGFSLMGKTFIGNGFITEHDKNGDYIPLQLHPQITIESLGLKWMTKTV